MTEPTDAELLAAIDAGMRAEEEAANRTAEAKWNAAQADIARHDAEFKQQHGKGWKR